MLFITILNLICLVFCTSIYDDSIPLPVLDERIMKAMRDPQKGKGDDLLSDAYNYYNILDDIETLLKEKDPQGIERMENLVKEGGPKFINATMEVDYMYHLFQWEPTEMNELRATIDGTKMVYDRMLDRLEEIKTGKKKKKVSSNEE